MAMTITTFMAVFAPLTFIMNLYGTSALHQWIAYFLTVSIVLAATFSMVRYQPDYGRATRFAHAIAACAVIMSGNDFRSVALLLLLSAVLTIVPALGISLTPNNEYVAFGHLVVAVMDSVLLMDEAGNRPVENAAAQNDNATDNPTSAARALPNVFFGIPGGYPALVGGADYYEHGENTGGNCGPALLGFGGFLDDDFMLGPDDDDDDGFGDDGFSDDG